MSPPSADANLVDRLFSHAGLFAADLASRPGVQRIPTPNFRERAHLEGTLLKPVVWINDVFTGPGFRWAHVEFFSIPDQIGVIHVCVFPHLDHQTPIFGFDIISGCKKATGAFLDFSPTTDVADVIVDEWAVETDKDRTAFEEHRTLPDWAAEIFSPYALAIRPISSREVDDVLTLGRTSLAMMLDTSAKIGPAAKMQAAQHRYISGQRRNDNTLRMLANCVGPDLAREFIDCWLFPTPSDPWPLQG